MRGGYRYVYKPDHPSAIKAGYVLEHRLVMETKLRRPLTKQEVVHHINHNKVDNNPENLTLLESTGKHFIAHHLRQRNSEGRFM